MIGKTTILFGRSGNQIRFSPVSSLGKNTKSNNKRKRIKSVAHSRPGLIIANYQPRLLIRRALHRKRIWLQLRKRTSLRHPPLETLTLSCSSKSSTQPLLTIVQLKIVELLLVEARKIRKKKRRRRKMLRRTANFHMVRWRITITWAIRRLFITIWRCTTKPSAKTITNSCLSLSILKKVWTIHNFINLSNFSWTPKIHKKRQF